MKKIIILLTAFCILLSGAFLVDSHLLKTRRPPLFSTWGYNITKEPSELTVSDKENNISKKFLTGTSSWFYFDKEGAHGVSSDFPHPAYREYSEESIIELKETTNFYLKDFDGKILYLKLYKSDNPSVFNELEFKGNEFTLELNEWGEYYLTVIAEYLQGTVCYDIKVIMQTDFSLEAKKSQSKRERRIIYSKAKEIKDIKNSPTPAIDYSVLSYGLEEINIRFDGNSLPLSDALKHKVITPEAILNKCEKDAKEGKIKSEMFKDGGSKIYKYEDYTIIKYNTLDGNRDMYIGTPDMDIKVGNFVICY